MWKFIKYLCTEKKELINNLMTLEKLNSSLSDQLYLDRHRLETANGDILRMFLFYNNNKVVISPQIQHLAMDTTIGVDKKVLEDGSLQLEIVDLMEETHDQEAANHRH